MAVLVMRRLLRALRVRPSRPTGLVLNDSLSEQDRQALLQALSRSRYGRLTRLVPAPHPVAPPAVPAFVRLFAGPVGIVAALATSAATGALYALAAIHWGFL